MQSQLQSHPKLHLRLHPLIHLLQPQSDEGRLLVVCGQFCLRFAKQLGGPPKPVVPLKLPEPEEDEEWSDDEDDDEIMAQQRAEFAKLFGASLQSLVDSKADEEFFNRVDKYVSRLHSKILKLHSESNLWSKNAACL